MKNELNLLNQTHNLTDQSKDSVLPNTDISMLGTKKSSSPSPIKYNLLKNVRKTNPKNQDDLTNQKNKIRNISQLCHEKMIKLKSNLSNLNISQNNSDYNNLSNVVPHNKENVSGVSYDNQSSDNLPVDYVSFSKLPHIK